MDCAPSRMYVVYKIALSLPYCIHDASGASAVYQLRIICPSALLPAWPYRSFDFLTFIGGLLSFDANFVDKLSRHS